MLISVNCSKEFWHLSPDLLSGFIRPKHFQFRTPCFFKLGLIDSGLGWTHDFSQDESQDSP